MSGLSSLRSALSFRGEKEPEGRRSPFLYPLMVLFSGSKRVLSTDRVTVVSYRDRDGDGGGVYEVGSLPGSGLGEKSVKQVRTKFKKVTFDLRESMN